MKAYASIFFIFISIAVYSQEIVPKERFGEVELGITYEDVIWILGFDGSKVTKESAPEMLTAPVNEIGIDFDYIVNFRYIMDLPITSVYVKDDLVVYFTISSYPEYNQFICQDLSTILGLKFWDNTQNVESLYGNNFTTLKFKTGNLTYLSYKDTGICFGMDNDQVRTIGIFNPDFK